jgi:hypothetical protein
MNRRLQHAVVSIALAGFVAGIPSSVAAKDPTLPDDSANGPQAVDVLPPKVQRLVDLATAVQSRSLTAGEIASLGKILAEERTATRVTTDDPSTRAASASAVSPLSVSVPGAPDTKTLGVSQYGQQHGNWCGPASAYSMIKYMAAAMGQTTASQYAADAGLSLSQPHLSGLHYTGATWTGNLSTSLGTSWFEKAMPRTLNRWLGLSGDYQYIQYTPKSAVDLAATVIAAIGWEWRPVAMETAEPAGDNYNGHKASLTIYHWVAVYSYKNLASVSMTAVDPATTVWGATDPTYTFTMAKAYHFAVETSSRGVDF